MCFTELHWQLPPSRPALQPCDLHLWSVSLNPSPSLVTALHSSLAPDELARASQITSALARRRFLAGRGFLRAILSRYLDLNPAHLIFSRNTTGKPSLSEETGCQHLKFNVARADSLMLCAVSESSAVGVDLEPLRCIEQSRVLATHFFSGAEQNELQSVADAHQSEAFLNAWTRKEAFLKAIDGDESQWPAEVSLHPGQPARLLSIAGKTKALAEWSLHAVCPAPGFLGAVAVKIPAARMSAWQWPRETALSPSQTAEFLSVRRN